MILRPLSPTLAYASVHFIEMLGRYGTLIEADVAATTIEGIPGGDVWAVTKYIRWIDTTATGAAEVLELGKAALTAGTAKLRFRYFIMNYVETVQPAWGQLVPKGRNEVRHQAPEEVTQVMREAGLFDSDDPDVVRFWDMLAARARGARDEYLTEIGRKGERLSINFESRRVGRQPKWMSLENNTAGYDILSVVDASSSVRMSIEVKTSGSGVGTADFFITRNEWDMATVSREYRFHLWDISSPVPLLAVVPVTDVADHVPVNHGYGAWEVVSVPFRAFAPTFSPIQSSNPVA